MSTIDEQTEAQTPPEEGDEAAGRPQLPPYALELSDEKRDEILNYLLQELQDAEAAREPRQKKWIKWRRQREAIPEATPSEHTLSNASRIEPPLMQIHAQTAYAKVKGYYDTSKEEFWQVKSASDDPESHKDAALWTKYLGILANSQMDLNLEKVKRDVSDESTFMGLLMVKVVWDTLEWKFKGDAGETKTMTFHDGPSIVPISQEDTLYPAFWDEVQRMPWIAQELHLPLHEFENKVMNGEYDEPKDANGQKIDVKTWLREDMTESEAEASKLRGFSPKAPKVIDLTEVHFFWDVDDDGFWEDLIFTIYRKTRTIVRKTFNGIALREFEPFGYIPKSFTLESRGIGQICEYLQDEASGTHRLRNDGMKLASIKMLAMRRAVLRENKNTIYQGKVWITDNPQEDMKEIALGEVPPSSLQSENLVWSLASQATGISSPDRGFADPTLGTRDTFRGQEMRMQMSQSIMATIIQSTSESWARVGMLVVFQLVKNAKRVMWNERALGRLKTDELDRLERMLSVDISEVPRKLKFEIYTTDIEHSYEARRDTMVQLAQITMQAQPQLMQLSQAILGPQGMQLKQIAPDAWEQMLEIYVGSVNMLKEIFRFADFADTEDYLQNVEKLEKLVEMMRAANDQQLQMMERMQQGGMGGMGMQGGGNGAGLGGPPAPGAGPAGAAQAGIGAPGQPPEQGAAGQAQGAGTGAGGV